jgi:hypothetical protein
MAIVLYTLSVSEGECYGINRIVVEPKPY